MAKVLIVDDERSIRRTLGEFLRDENHAVEEVDSADAALRLLREAPFDIVVSDIILPKTSGVELLRSIQGASPDVLVIMMTGEPTVETAQESLRAGALDYLAKPIGKTDIVKAVAAAERIKRLSDTRTRLEAENRAYTEQLERLVAERTAALEGELAERKRMEVGLRESEQRYRNLVETVFGWVWELDAQGRYTYASPQVQDILGFTPDEILGRTPFDLMDPIEAERVRILFEDILIHRRSFTSLENTNRHKDGHAVTLETSGVPVIDSEGVLIGYRGMDRDISHAKRLEAQFLQAQKLEAVGQLAGGVAHDFNNIIAAMMMQLSLLKDLPNLDPETRDLLDELVKEARRGANMTRQLLMFSRRSVLEVRPLDLNEVIRGLLKMLRRLVGENIALQQVEQLDLPWVEADVGMVEQVLMNLVVNARDAMPKGGQINIRTSRAHFEPSALPNTIEARAGDFVCIGVSDTGCGMDQSTMKRVFEPFFSTKAPGQGTGLGLATVHGIVAQHKGWVELESTPGAGTTFSIFLPVSNRSRKGSSYSTVEDPAPRGTETILLVEDDSILRRRISALLTALGYLVLEASCPAEAREIWARHHRAIALLLTDIVMPGGVTGLELSEELMAAQPELRVILSSGYSPEIVKTGAPNKPGVAFLPKPYEPLTLARTIRSLLATSAA